MSDDPVSVRHSELVDAPNYTGASLRPSGVLGLYIRGRGLSCGPLPPDQLRALAHQALGIADALEAKAEAAAEIALQELSAIVGHA